MVKDIGGVFGWLLIIAFAGTILNYCVKAINKRFGKKIFAHPIGKTIMQTLMKIFVRNHRYFGFAAVVFLLVHVILQLLNYGVSITGFVAGGILIFQVGLGIYSIGKKKPRKGLWFITHRVLAVLLILGIAIHLIVPFGFVANSHEEPEGIDQSQLQVFTLKELSEYDGENGNKAYVAYEGYVYDVTDVPAWNGGEHNRQKAGQDITDFLNRSPHGSSVFEKLEIVGKME